VTRFAQTPGIICIEIIVDKTSDADILWMGEARIRFPLRKRDEREAVLREAGFNFTDMNSRLGDRKLQLPNYAEIYKKNPINQEKLLNSEKLRDLTEKVPNLLQF